MQKNLKNFNNLEVVMRWDNKKAPVLLKNTGTFVFFTRPARLIGKGKFCSPRRPDAPSTRGNGRRSSMD